MSGDDLLTRAAAALRVSTTEDAQAATNARAAGTRANVLLAASARARRRKVIALVWPLAAALVLSTAWAGTHGASTRWARVASLFEGERAMTLAHGAAPAEKAPTALARANQRGADASGGAIDTRKSDDADQRVLPENSQNSSLVKRPAASAAAKMRDAPVAAAASSASNGAASETEAAALYAAAHRAHFVDRDPEAALVAWDAYLAAAPDGTLAPEARYNRGVTFVRLGRYDDARRALAPFAADSGGYRGREAKRLIDVMDAH